MSGFANSVMFADNVNFSGTTPRMGEVTTDGELLIGNTAGPNIQVGNITSPGGTLSIGYSSPNITIDMVPVATYSLSPFIVGPDVNSQFSTVQAAIDQAVVDGASDANPKNIYIKPGTYVESLSITTGGINLIAFNSSGDGLTGDIPRQVIIRGGGLTFGVIVDTSGETFTATGIQFEISGTSNFRYTEAIIYLSNCTIIGDFAAFDSITNTDNQISLYNVYATGSAASARAFFFSTSTGTVVIRDKNCIFEYSSTTSSAFSGTSVVWDSAYSDWRGYINVSSTTAFSWFPYYCKIEGSDLSLITTGASVTGSFNAHACTFIDVADPFLNIGNSSFILAFAMCTFDADYNLTLQNGQVQEASLSLVEGSGSVNGLAFGDAKTGFQGSLYTQKQGFVQTTDATPTELFSVVVNEGESITIQGVLIAALSDHTDMQGGAFQATARRASGANVVVTASNVQELGGSAATYTLQADTGNQTVQLLVTGIVAETWNWGATYQFMKILTNS